MSVQIVVPGRARPQGSKRPFVNKHTGRAHMTEQSVHLKDWRARIAHEAALPEVMFTDVPLAVSIWCVFARPKSHYRTGKNAHMLKPDAPARPISRSTGDADKLARAVLDGLTGACIADDSLVVDLRVTCSYGERERCEITVGDVYEWPTAKAAA